MFFQAKEAETAVTRAANIIKEAQEGSGSKG
jgi:hypothetical protein